MGKYRAWADRIRPDALKPVHHLSKHAGNKWWARQGSLPIMDSFANSVGVTPSRWNMSGAKVDSIAKTLPLDREAERNAGIALAPLRLSLNPSPIFTPFTQTL
jgi:hypothetical protein